MHKTSMGQVYPRSFYSAPAPLLDQLLDPRRGVVAHPPRAVYRHVLRVRQWPVQLLEACIKKLLL